MRAQNDPAHDQRAARVRKPPPGSRWRILAHERGRPVELADRGVFDELVIDDWFHLEQMDTRAWWMEVAGLALWVRIRRNGTAEITFTEARTGTARRRKLGRIESKDRP